MRGLLRSLADIWRLSLPYFTTRDIGEARIWPVGIGRYRVKIKWATDRAD